MTIKAKISLGLGFMFAIILGLGGLGAYYLHELADDSQAILKDNYSSLQYTSDMQKALLDRATDPDAAVAFGVEEHRLVARREAGVSRPVAGRSGASGWRRRVSE